jgi:hypothetical protein
MTLKIALPTLPATPTIVPKEFVIFFGRSFTNFWSLSATSFSWKYRPNASSRSDRRST